MLERHVEPIAIILRANPSGGPETENETDLSQDDLVVREVGPVSGFQLLDLGFLALKHGAIRSEADLCFAEMLYQESYQHTTSTKYIEHENRS